MGILNRVATAAVHFSRVATHDPVIEQLQKELERCFSNIPAPVTDADGIVRIDNASGAKTYTVTDADKHVVCITNGGPLTVALPAPTAKRVIGILANGPHQATVQRADGKDCSFGPSKALDNAASLFVADGVDWYLE